jgi:hypothetical protein
MKRMFAILACALFACASEPTEQPTPSDESEASEELTSPAPQSTPGGPETSALQCGLNCGAGRHAASYSCNLGCGPCPPNNQADCFPNTGSSFFMCGLRCPTPYHIVSSQQTLVCASNGSATGLGLFCAL